MNIDAFARHIFPTPSNIEAIYIAEAKYGFSRIEPYLGSGEILEVGAGAMILAAYLASAGYRVAALEPLSMGFQHLREIQERVRAVCKARGIHFEVIDARAEDLDVHDRFSLVFSINVLEHVEAPRQMLHKAYRALAEGGTALMCCPNYHFPYDSHFGIPLLGKRLTEIVFAKRIATMPDVWRTLNFVTRTDVLRICGEIGITPQFNRDVMTDMIARIAEPEFRARVPAVLRGALSLASRARWITRCVPLSLQPYMEFTMSKDLCVADSRDANDLSTTAMSNGPS